MDDEWFSLSGGVDVVAPKKAPKRCASLLLWPEPIDTVFSYRADISGHLNAMNPFYYLRSRHLHLLIR